MKNTAYTFHRRAGKTAAAALAAARADLAAGVTRYLSAPGGWQDGARHAAHGCDGLQWFENPRRAGLRFVGYADQLARIEHEGWFVDSTGCGDVARGVVYQMPARHGRARYLVGYECPYNAGTVCLDLADIREGEKGGHGNPASWCDGADDATLRDAAREADRIADLMAEDSREHDAAYQAGASVARLREEARELRAGLRELLRALRPSRGAALLELPPAICARLRADVARDWRDLERLREEIAGTLRDWSAPWRRELGDTFRDGLASGG